jgi:hypothetical protein
METECKPIKYEVEVAGHPPECPMNYEIAFTRSFKFATTEPVKAGQHASEHPGITRVYGCEFTGNCKLKCRFGEILSVENLGEYKEPAKIGKGNPISISKKPRQ